MFLNHDLTLLFIGTSDGNIMIFDIFPTLDNLKYINDDTFKLKKIFRAHISSITSVSSIDTQNIILTSSKDCSVRLWTLDGDFIGTFGQDDAWDIEDPETYSNLPNDIYQQYLIDSMKMDNDKNSDYINRMKLKEKADKNWSLIRKYLKKIKQNVDKNDNSNENPKSTNETINKALDALHQAKEINTIKSNQSKDILIKENPVQFFTYRGLMKKSRVAPVMKKVRADLVFHQLSCHELEDIRDLENEISQSAPSSLLPVLNKVKGKTEHKTYSQQKNKLNIL
jgi:hypothetical protein